MRRFFVLYIYLVIPLLNGIVLFVMGLLRFRNASYAAGLRRERFGNLALFAIVSAGCYLVPGAVLFGSMEYVLRTEMSLEDPLMLNVPAWVAHALYVAFAVRFLLKSNAKVEHAISRTEQCRLPDDLRPYGK